MRTRGRPPKLDLGAQLAVAVFCEERARLYARKQAETRMRRGSKALSKAEELMRDARTRGERHDPQRVAAYFSRSKRVCRSEEKRHYGTRAKVIQEAAEHFGISERAVVRYWKQHKPAASQLVAA